MFETTGSQYTSTRFYCWQTEEINLYGCSVEGPIPAEIFALENLCKLFIVAVTRLSYNALLLSSMPFSHTLLLQVNVNLARTQLTGELPTNLTSIDHIGKYIESPGTTKNAYVLGCMYDF